MNIHLVKRFIQQKRYRFSVHAEQEREADHVTVEEFEQALRSPEAEVIEAYPNDPRGPSCLVVGFTIEGRPVHAVLGRQENVLIVITVYQPDPHEWIRWRKRRS